MEWLELITLLLQCDPRSQRQSADAGWSPAGFVALFLFAAFAVMYCVGSPHP